MSTTVKRRNGGYFTVPNRWIDAGYMAAAPGSVTLVYLHLSRWADNGTLSSSQPMRLIARKCGLSEDVARKAVRTLEAWGVLDRDPDSGRNAANVWLLNDLEDKAPEYPDKLPPKESGGPKKVGVQESGGPYQPDVYQPEYDYPPEDIEGTPSSSSPIQPRDIVNVWAEVCNGGAWPVNKGPALRAAKTLVDGGITPDDARSLIAWMQADDFWGKKAGIDLGKMVKAADAWRSRQSAVQAKRERLVY